MQFKLYSIVERRLMNGIKQYYISLQNWIEKLTVEVKKIARNFHFIVVCCWLTSLAD